MVAPIEHVSRYLAVWAEFSIILLCPLDELSVEGSALGALMACLATFEADLLPALTLGHLLKVRHFLNVAVAGGTWTPL